MCGLFVGVSWYDTIAELTRHPDLQVSERSKISRFNFFLLQKIGFLQHHGNDIGCERIQHYYMFFATDRLPGVPGEGNFWRKVSFACKLHFGGYGSM